ncbi:MAG: biotin--[acetyl-CoA-carboxylase] ligase [Dehalococcoidia bacterium]
MPFNTARYHAARRSRTTGAEVVHVEETASTMDDARAGAEAGHPPGTAYVAAAQSAGRGRLGRSWVSEPGAGLWVTYHLRLSEGVPPERAPLLSVAGALAVADAIEGITGLTCDLKWPNDVQHAGRKVCGVLAESRAGVGGFDVFLGIGVNLRTPEGLPPEVAALATSIEQEGRPAPSREVLLGALSTALEARAEQAQREPSMLIADWRARLVTLGRRVRLALPGDRTVEGEAVDVTDLGELVIEADGERRAYSAGDVTSTRPVA